MYSKEFETAMECFKSAQYDMALNYFVLSHSMGQDTKEAEDFVLDSYYNPNVDYYRDIYQENINILKSRSKISFSRIPEFHELSFCFLPYSDTSYEIYDKNACKFIGNIDFGSCINLDGVITSGEVILAANEFQVQNLLELERRCRDKKAVLSQKKPFFIFYDQQESFFNFLQLGLFKQLLEIERVVVLLGSDDLGNWFENPYYYSYLPQKIWGHPVKQQEINAQVEKIREEHEERLKRNKKDIFEYYESLDIEDIHSRLNSGTPRIMFQSNRFTTDIRPLTGKWLPYSHLK